jgi:hypothetical protein
MAGRVTSARSAVGCKEPFLDGAMCSRDSWNSYLSIGDRGDDGAVDIIEPDSVKSSDELELWQEPELTDERCEVTKMDESALAFHSRFREVLLVFCIGQVVSEKRG